MRKETVTWKVKDLERHHSQIEFPEYQREPNVWSKAAKQRLIDSLLRRFDIASIYLYEHSDGSLDCIDGQQRIGAIMSFLNKNEEDEDNGFALTALNEIYTDKDADLPYRALNGETFVSISQKASTKDPLAPTAKRLIEHIHNCDLTIVKLLDSKRPEEFNLQFTRLNLGTILNSGEKLHAMVGEMRDVCFATDGLGQHAFLESVKIPTRRFSKEQVAAQLLTQVFSLKANKEFARTRHFDIAKFFKDHSALTKEQRGWISEVSTAMDALAGGFKWHAPLRNRAITVSFVLLALSQQVKTVKQAEPLASFIEEFVARLSWQVRKGIDLDQEYRHLIDFQRHVTQASVEKPAVKARDEMLKGELKVWLATKKLTGDDKYKKRTGSDPAADSRGQR